MAASVERALVRVAITGASGRMGRTLIEALTQDQGVQLSGALDLPGSAWLGRDAGAALGLNTGVLMTDDARTALSQTNCLIDFTRPEGSLAYLQACVDCGVPMVIGTTGFDAAGKAAIEQAAQHIAVVFAPNMSVGVNATMRLLDLAARMLKDGYDVEVIEAHHRQKVDAPSGTALHMGEVIAQAQGHQLADCAIFAREGHTGVRPEGAIGFATLRGGDIVGDHTVMFAGQGERIEITHRSGSRMGYAQGSLRAAKFLMQHQRGLFTMQDVLGF